MDLLVLQELSENGFSAVRPDKLGDLGDWCRDYAEATGDARYFSIGEALLEVHSWWAEHDEYGGIPVKLRDELEEILTSKLPSILSLTDPSEATPLARLLRQQLEARLTSPRQWIDEGLVEPPGVV